MPVSIYFSCQELTELIDGELIGNSSEKLISLNRIDSAGKGEITFYSDDRYEKYLEPSEASCIIVPNKFEGTPKPGQCFIKVENPHDSIINLLRLIESKQKTFVPGRDKTAVIADSAEISTDTYIGPGCVIGSNVTIGSGSQLIANVVIYDNSTIGRNTILHANSTLYSDTVIGSDCIIHAGAVIGSDGFGFQDKENGTLERIPQLGNVIIEDQVEIGANTTIDRSMIGSTIIRRGTKLDNLVQIAHNVTVGENTAIASQAGIAGTVNIGKRNRIAGQVGIAGHMDTTDNVILIAQSGVSKSLVKPGVYFGSPAKEVRKQFRIEAAMRLLPDVIEDIKLIKRKLNENSG